MTPNGAVQTTTLLYPEAEIGELLRGKFMDGLRALAQELRWPGVSALENIATLYKKNWRVIRNACLEAPNRYWLTGQLHPSHRHRQLTHPADR